MRPYIIPTAEIYFAAQAGFLSKPLWKEFFAQGSERWKREQWFFFKQRGLFIPHPSRFAKDILVLNKKSPVVKRIVGETISAPPFVAQIEHDEIVARIVLLLKKSNQILGYKFEAELKREEWAEKILYSRTSKTKLPDGVFEIERADDISKIAIELELSRKNQKRYNQILATYAAQKNLSHVLFLARSKTIFNAIKVAMVTEHNPRLEKLIGFCDLDLWLKSPFRAPIYFGQGITSLEKMTALSKAEINRTRQIQEI